MRGNRKKNTVLTIVSVILLIPATLHCWAYYVPPPSFSRATNLPNEVFEWRGQKIRYQVAKAESPSAPTAILIHGLFVNSDHWRKTLKGLSAAGYNAYAIDLLGYGYSSKPPRESTDARKVNGENSRFFAEGEAIPSGKASESRFSKSNKQKYQSVLRDVRLGTSTGK